MNEEKQDDSKADEGQSTHSGDEKLDEAAEEERSTCGEEKQDQNVDADAVIQLEVYIICYLLFSHHLLYSDWHLLLQQEWTVAKDKAFYIDIRSRIKVKGNK